MNFKVIFLDIDGVLNVYCEDRDEYGCTFHQHLVENLEMIIRKTGAKIVISSTWRLSGLIIMKEMWEKRNLPGEVIDITPFHEDRVRGNEIQEWINQYNPTNYVIIDDDSDILSSQTDNFVRTSNNPDHIDCVDVGYGLTKNCAEQAIKILNKK